MAQVVPDPVQSYTQTTDASWVRTSLAVEIPEGSAVLLRFSAMAMDYAGSYAKWANVTAIAQRYARGSASVVGGSITEAIKQNTSGTAANWNIRLVGDGPCVYLEVRGDSGVAVDWMAETRQLSTISLQGSSALYAGSTLSTGLIYSYKMEEASGTRADYVRGLDLTDNNSVGQTAGQIGYGASFVAASSQYLSRGSETLLQTGDIDFTGAVFTSCGDVSATRTIVAKSDGGSATEYALRVISSKFQLTVSDGASYGNVVANTFGSLSNNTPYCVIFWHDSINNLLGIEVNGVVDTVAWTTGVTVGNASLAVGRLGDYADQYWQGWVDILTFWKKTLTTAERVEYRNGGAGKEPPF